MFLFLAVVGNRYF